MNSVVKMQPILDCDYFLFISVDGQKWPDLVFNFETKSGHYFDKIINSNNESSVFGPMAISFSKVFMAVHIFL